VHGKNLRAGAISRSKTLFKRGILERKTFDRDGNLGYIM